MERHWRFYFFSILILILSYCPFTFASKPTYPSFASAEHVIAGDNVRLFFSATDTGKRHYVFHLPSGLNISYGELLAFGDMYGTIGHPISTAETESERNALFLAAFDAFALNPKTLKEAKNLIEIMRDEQKLVNDGMKNGQTPEQVYNKIHSEMGRRLNCVTGGGCSSAWWLTPGRYLNLAKADYDHFYNNAWIAYKTGHKLAIQEAIIAGKTSDVKRLELAYAMNGFACHFLSDRFAAGHIRTPRQELAESVTPKVLGSLLAHYMHDEENAYGLHVHNIRGNSWIAYGDYSYLNPKNNYNLLLLDKALQISAKQIFYAYQYGVEQPFDVVYSLIPAADEVRNASNVDISPLFYWDDQTLTVMRRQILPNAYDRHWTQNWWGWSTLALLIEQAGELPAILQARLALSNSADQALELGFITEKNIVNFIKQKQRSARNSTQSKNQLVQVRLGIGVKHHEN